jgi:mannose-6-phosphate isomerase-like protein (cupin superfamily)
MRLCCSLPVLASLLLAASAEGNVDRFGVTFVPGPVARAQIEKTHETDGIALIDYARTSTHSVLVVRRTKPGQAEVHTELTDVWYVIDGSATFVTGGMLNDSKTVAPHELRGTGVAGGVSRHISKGDVIDIPAGVPHWVSQVDGKELVYLTVKVASGR